MVRLFALVLVVAGLAMAGSPGTAEAQADKPKTDADLQGTWKLDKVYDKYEGGNQSYIALSSKYVMTVKGEDVTVETEDGGKKVTRKYMITTDGSKSPKVYTRTAADEKKNTVTGIYKIEKDKLLMCFQKDGNPPEGFTVKRDDGKDRAIYEFVRVKP